MRMPPSPTVTAVVPHWNRRDLLAALLDNLLAQQRRFDEIIVVDNGSTDGSADVARGRGARVIQLEHNAGFAAAVNRGIEASHSDWIGIINNDVTLAGEWLRVMLEAASRDDPWFVAGKILSADNPAILDGAFDEVSRGACAARCGAGKRDAAIWNQPRSIRIAPMTAALFRTRLFQLVGNLDEVFGSYMEDAEFGIRCALGGYAGAYAPAAVAFHQGSATLGKWSADSVWRISRNQLLLAVKHFAGQPRLPILTGQALWGLLAARHGCGWAFLRGKVAGWKDRRLFGPRDADAGRKKRLSSILEASEKEIIELGRQTGLDSYWRGYFWLLPR
jgi:N-acetylglucosaminyl-diphospho-decaprenol L-rhamnosyltransferase